MKLELLYRPKGANPLCRYLATVRGVTFEVYAHSEQKAREEAIRIRKTCKTSQRFS